MKISKNCVVTLTYRVIDKKGTILDTGNEPLVYLHGGYKDVFEKVENALEGKSRGDEIEVSLKAKESFGEFDESLIVTQARDEFDANIHVGEEFEEIFEDELTGEEESMLYIVKEITNEHVVLDGNHPFAGHDVIFYGTVASVRTASKEEIKQGYAR